MTGPAAIVRAHYDIFNRGDFDAWVDLLTPDFTVHHASFGATEGRDTYLAGVRAYRVAFPDVTVEVSRILEGGDLAAAEFASTATFVADWQGIPATGKEWVLPGMGFYRVEGERLAEAWFVEDVTGWFQGLAAR